MLHIHLGQYGIWREFCGKESVGVPRLAWTSELTLLLVFAAEVTRPIKIKLSSPEKRKILKKVLAQHASQPGRCAQLGRRLVRCSCVCNGCRRNYGGAHRGFVVVFGVAIRGASVFKVDSGTSVAPGSPTLAVWPSSSLPCANRPWCSLYSLFTSQSLQA
jgi:hypothetical protein